MRLQRRISGLASLAVVLASPVAGSEAPPRACYTRTYDAAHFKQHPGQTVRAVNLVIAYRKLPDGARFRFTARVVLDAFDDAASVSGDCGFRDPDGMEVNMPDASTLAGDALIACTADGDGGGMILERRARSTAALLKLQEHFVVHGTCGKRPCDDDLMKRRDDKVFLLERTSDAVCAPMERATQ